MIKRLSFVIILCVLTFVVFTFNSFASSDWDAEMVVSLFRSAMGDNFSGQDTDIAVYNDNSVRMVLDTNTAKDTVLGKEDEFITEWNTMRDSFTSLSENGYAILKSLGYDDKCFIVTIMDDIYDETSDIWLVIVNGNVVYDVFA